MSKTTGGVSWHATVNYDVYDFNKLLLFATISCTADSLDKYPVRAEVTVGFKHPNEGRNNKLGLNEWRNLTFSNRYNILMHSAWDSDSTNVPILLSFLFISRIVSF
jgi:hypothetical protein